ncbi:MAG TPA: photosystem reaction center subunit H [Oscillatoriales cyanobacterium M59_W2019_021]|nr:photosystem reaction center subunit H [Oscillatoriales cyanobacterium M59_W2019_021]
MVNVVRRSQIVGLAALDQGTATQYGTVEEIWVDDSGQVTYFASDNGYTPIDQVSMVGPDAVLTYSYTSVQTPANLRRLSRLAVRSASASDPIGWIDDFLFDWETGDIVAYILGGDIASPFGGQAVLFPEDVEVIDAEAVVIKQDAKNRLKSVSEGLKGFLSEKSQQVKTLVKRMGDRLQSLVNPDDKPEVVKVKIKEVKDELSASGKHDQSALAEAAEFLEGTWEEFQRSVSRTSKRMKRALDNTWKRLTGKV